MSVSKIANRYAKSFVDLGKANNNLPALIDDAKAILDMGKNKDFSLFLKSPIINVEKKLNVINELFSGKVENETLNFLTLVVRKNRENILPQVLDKAVETFNDLQGVSRVTLTSASELTDAEFEKISDKLKDVGLVKNNVEYTKKLDPALIGGFIIELGDKLYDASIAGKLRRVKKELI